MPSLRGVLYALRTMLRRSTADRDTADEMAYHMERETQRLIGQGVAPDEASRVAQARFGGATRWREETADARPGQLLESVWRDVALAARTLAARPAFTIPALLTLALGIGANTAVFSVLRGVVLSPLNYHEPDRLVAIWPNNTISAAELVFLQKNARSFASVAAFSPGWGYNMIGVGEPMQVDVARTSANFFDALGVAPRLGRGFLEAESAPGSATAVVLSHRLWVDRFGADSAVVGRDVSMNDRPHRIVGVARADFEAFQPGVEAWIPLENDPASPFYRGQVALAFGRLRPGVSQEQAQSELATFIPRLRELLDAPRDYGAGYTVEPLRDQLVARSRLSLFVLFGAACFIVLIAAANYGNLLLLRVAGRRREVAVRAALGASRGRIARQFLIDSLVLSMTGGVLGFGLAAGGVRALRLLLPQDLPRLASVSVDAGLLAACAALAVLIGIVCGAAPAIFATRGAQHDALRRGSGARVTGGGGLRGALVVVEFASALVLLVGAGLMLQTIWRMQRVDPGFAAEGLLTFRLQPTTTRVGEFVEPAAYYDELLERIAAVPGVERVGSTQHLPLTGFNWGAPLEVEGRPTPAGSTPPRVTWRIVNGDYFGAMRIPVRGGRVFTSQDGSNGARAVIVNETMARRFWPNEDAVGKRIRLGRATQQQSATIVGVVGDVRYLGLHRSPENEAYVPISQAWQSSAHLVVRASGDPMRLMPAIRRIIRAHDGTVPISAIRPMRAVVSASFAQAEMVMRLLIAFAAVGVALGGVGIYGVISYDVTQRTREIGIRAALGAASQSLHGLVLRRAGALALAGIGLGAGVALVAARALETLVFGVEVRDPLTYAALALLLMLVAMVAAHVPARRAVRVDPVLALRSD